ncbi:MAG TPA: adenine phosphoribosyltransferase [Clostridia bacterium]|jgi:adenine phosphoribosyltransferase|nr:MAG: Adenine phosphoribosyltransferase [Firmicutes bacterium ADurb.Bin248]HOG00961.1 adenine phosphoribosyltransferase [Clostridia bacterium]HOS18944.1 adenine phosphoribosyltransferase [Clostridia bacterium]HPK15515.1 adenine phosphoribosyltransferase [Clostridia bacterium]
MDLRSTIRSIPDFPKAGVLFRDVTTLIKNPEAYRALIDGLANDVRHKNIDLVVGPEARGFVIGSALAYALGAGFVLARKPGKLPYKTIRHEYALEYGTDSLEIHVDAIEPGQRVVVVDDLLATGGTALATIRLVEQAGGVVVAARFAIELSELGGREALRGYDVAAAIVY